MVARIKTVGVMLNPFEASCKETGKHLSGHVEGELRGLRRRRVSRHLARCERCQAILRSLRETIAGLGLLGRQEPEPMPGLVDAVLARIREEGDPGVPET